MFTSRDNVHKARNKGDLISAIFYLLSGAVDIAIYCILCKFYVLDATW